MLNARRTRDQEIVIAGRIAPKQSRDVGDCFASLAMTTESWSLADLGSHALRHETTEDKGATESDGLVPEPAQFLNDSLYADIWFCASTKKTVFLCAAAFEPPFHPKNRSCSPILHFLHFSSIFPSSSFKPLNSSQFSMFSLSSCATEYCCFQIDWRG